MSPRILISNDDGIRSPGIIALASAMSALGEVTVVAPDRQRSAASRAISLHRPLRLHQTEPGWYACDGTPTDSVYLGVHHVLAPKRPDLVVSGINTGANLANDVTYSGTVAAALEGCVFGIPSISFSLCTPAPFDFGPTARFAATLAARVLEEGLPKGVLLNVNVPPGDPDSYRVTHLGRRGYGEFVEVRKDPRGRRYYWIGGGLLDHEDIPGSDCNVVYDEARISVTPLHLDLTAHESLETVRGWKLPGFGDES